MKVNELIAWLEQHANPNDEVRLDIYIEDGGSYYHALYEHNLSYDVNKRLVEIEVDA